MTIGSCSRDSSRFAYFKDVQTYILSRPYYIGESFIQEILYLSIAVIYRYKNRRISHSVGKP